MDTCWKCNNKLQIIKNKAYHYTECGLNNIYLQGIIQYKCPECGEAGAEIPHIKDLHLLIGRDIICKSEHLTGDEVRFLRKELGLKSKDMAETLSLEKETYSRWENCKHSASTSIDRYLRLLYILNVSEKEGKVLHKNIREMLNRVAIRPPSLKKMEISPAEWLGGLETPLFNEQCA